MDKVVFKQLIKCQYLPRWIRKIAINPITYHLNQETPMIAIFIVCSKSILISSSKLYSKSLSVTKSSTTAAENA